MIFYGALTGLQLMIYTFLKPIGSAPNAAFVSFLPSLGIAFFQTLRTWPAGEGPRFSRFFQDFVLSLGAGLALFLALMVFQFFIVALGASAEGLFSRLIEAIAFLGFWAGFGIFFHFQRLKAQHLGMNWTEIEVVDDDPTVELEHESFTEIQEALLVLNLDEDVDEKRLKERWHQLSLLYHPDRLSSMSEQTRKVAEAEFQRIQQAYELVKIALKNDRL